MEEAIRQLKSAQQEFEQIRRDAENTGGDLDLAWSRLERWKERTASKIEKALSKKEGDRFREERAMTFSLYDPPR